MRRRPPRSTPTDTLFPYTTLFRSRRDADGGRTAVVNGQGLCERCNYVKETPGWTSWVPTLLPGARHEVHGVSEHLRITRSTRSEEHTSELQSLMRISYAVFCLKKNKHTNHTYA